MTDNRPDLDPNRTRPGQPPHDLNTTEMRQGDKRKMNSRALIFGLIGVVIVLALAVWWGTATQEDTATTTGGGTTLEDVETAPDAVDSNLDALPTPAPVVEPEPVEPAPAPAATPEPAIPAPDTAVDEPATTPDAALDEPAAEPAPVVN